MEGVHHTFKADRNAQVAQVLFIISFIWSMYIILYQEGEGGGEVVCAPNASPLDLPQVTEHLNMESRQIEM